MPVALPQPGHGVKRQWLNGESVQNAGVSTRAMLNVSVERGVHGSLTRPRILLLPSHNAVAQPRWHKVLDGDGLLTVLHLRLL